jgi:hypothetical protein
VKADAVNGQLTPHRPVLIILAEVDAGAAGKQTGAGFGLAMMVRQRGKPGGLEALPNQILVAGACCGPTPVISFKPPDWAVLPCSWPFLVTTGRSFAVI